MAGKAKLNRISPITAYSFKGMNNLPREPARLLDRQSRITPYLVLNAIVTDAGVIIPREGFTKTIAKGFHSLWGGTVMFGVGVSDNILYRIDGTSYLPLTTLPGPRRRLQYAEINNRVYMANYFWRGSYDLLSGQMGAWGVPLPPAPQIAIEEGGFPPGRYILCYTQTQGGEMSGNGPLVQVTWEETDKGIRLLNLPAGAQCWVTQPNGKKLMLAEVADGVILGHHPKGEPLISLSMEPPQNFEDFGFAHGRIWGARDNRLYYSFPGTAYWFRQGDYRVFPEPIIMVAPVNEGIFISSRTSTWYLQGRDPAKMEVHTVGDGAIPGTMTLASMPASLAGGAATSANFGTMSQLPSPLWWTPTGCVVGTHTGHLTNLTDHRLRFTPRYQGASLFQVKEGIPQIITTLYGPPAIEVENDNLSPIFQRGSLF